MASEPTTPDALVDVLVVGAGAAGLMAAIQAARAAPGLRVVAVDGAARLGRKILIAGGGRCNVTHHRVVAEDFAGASPRRIARVLRAFDVEATVAFFEDLGVSLKREPTGKLFPTTDRARTVLDALLGAARSAGVVLHHPFRVERIDASPGGGLVARGPHGALAARRLVLATGGRSVAATGSDGHGYALARALGHTTTPHLLPGLVPLLLPEGHPLTALRGVSCDVSLEVQRASGRRLARVEGSLLLTHFGLSGPAAMDASRHWLLAREADAGARLVVRWLPGEDGPAIDERLQAPGARLHDLLADLLPARLAACLLAIAGIEADATTDHLRREARRRLVAELEAMVLPVTGPRGWDFAEVTAGGVPLEEVDLATMASRCRAGLHLCGEILDVDGPIGGFNFQWAWSSGTVAGRGAARALADD